MCEKLEHFSLPYLEFKTTLKRGETKSFGVNVKYKKLLNSFSTPKILVYDSSTNNLLAFSIPKKVNFVCDGNGFCNLNIGENYGNCPKDCLSGKEDFYCDRQNDGRCDPDCLAELDEDCGKGEGKEIPQIPDYVFEGEKGEIIDYDIGQELRNYRTELGIPENPKVAVPEKIEEESKSFFSIIGRVIADIFS